MRGQRRGSTLLAQSKLGEVMLITEGQRSERSPQSQLWVVEATPRPHIEIVQA
jgi:hypothetical protein